MNTAIFAGRLGRDSDLRSTTGDPVLNFSIAVDVGFGDKKETLWVSCALWGKRAEKLEPFLTKGKQVTVCGDVGIRTYEAKDKTTRAELTLNVQRVTLQGGGQEQPASKPVVAEAEFSDDIPF